MSVLRNQTYANVDDSFFLLNNNNVNFLSSLNVYNGSINVSEINLDAIRMDCAILNSTPTLLLNGTPVASTSSFTSSVVTWSSYPALSPITYAVGGGVANLTNVNALSNLSSATVVGGTITANTTLAAGTSISTPSLTVSTINGAPFPSPTTALINITSAPITNGVVIPVDCSTLPSGFYMMEVYISAGGTDPFTCSTILRNFGSQIFGGCFHCPVISGNPPSFANCVSIQDNGSGSNTVSVIIYANNASAIGQVAQISVYRLT